MLGSWPVRTVVGTVENQRPSARTAEMIERLRPVEAELVRVFDFVRVIFLLVLVMLAAGVAAQTPGMWQLCVGLLGIWLPGAGTALFWAWRNLWDVQADLGELYAQWNREKALEKMGEWVRQHPDIVKWRERR